MKQLNTKQKEENINNKMENKQPTTILEHIECIVELVENSGLNKEFFQKAQKSISHVAEKMELTTNQAILFSIFIENSDSNSIYTSDFFQAHRLSVSKNY